MKLSKPKLALTKTRRMPEMRFPAVTSETLCITVSGWGVIEVRYRESPTLNYQLLSRRWFRTDQISELIRPIDAEFHISAWNMFGKAELLITPLRWSDDHDETLAYTEFGPKKIGFVSPVCFDMSTHTLLIKPHSPSISADINPKFKGMSNQPYIDLPKIKTPTVARLSLKRFSIKLPSTDRKKSNTD